MISVSIVAENMPMRVGLREVINSITGLMVVAVAARINDLSVTADVMVAVAPLDLHKIGKDQPILCLVNNSTEILDISVVDYPIFGILPVNSNEDELRIAIQAIAEGLWIGTPRMLKALILPKIGSELGGVDLPTQPLTIRETEVLQLAAQGLANKQMALNLKISEHTIKFHLSSIYAKLGATNRTEAVRSGLRQGLVIL